MTLERKPDWLQQLSAYLRSVATKEHSYGEHDCMIHVANAIKAQTGKDFARGHRGKYNSEASAKRYLKKLGFDSPLEMITSNLPEQDVTFAQRGDVVADEEGVPGICMGGLALFVGQVDEEAGLVPKPRSAWTRAWKV